MSSEVSLTQTQNNFPNLNPSETKQTSSYITIKAEKIEKYTPKIFLFLHEKTKSNKTFSIVKIEDGNKVYFKVFKRWCTNSAIGSSIATYNELQTLEKLLGSKDFENWNNLSDEMKEAFSIQKK